MMENQSCVGCKHHHSPTLEYYGRCDRTDNENMECIASQFGLWEPMDSDISEKGGL